MSDHLISNYFKQTTSYQTALTWYAALALQALIASPLFQLLPGYTLLKRELNTLKTSKDTSKKIASKEMCLRPFLDKHLHMLSSPAITPYVVLLAALNGLQSAGVQKLYAKTLKEILTLQLHHMELPAEESLCIGRDQEMQTIERILKRKERNSVLLLGPSGVGKTTLALHTASQLKKITVLQLFPTKDLEDQMATLLSLYDTPLLFFIDELFSCTPEQIRFLLNTASVIATAHTASYSTFLSDHPQLLTRIETLLVNEPSRVDVEKIIDLRLATYRSDDKIMFDDQFASELVQLSRQYIAHPAFPAKAIVILAEAVIPARTQTRPVVSLHAIRHIIAQKTHIPVETLTDIDKKDLSRLPEHIKERVIGQDEAVEKVAQAIRRARIGLKKQNKPIGSFLFIGPSGVGKTELSKALTQEIFGDVSAMVRIDMSEFSEAHMVQRLIGAPPGYIGYEEGGQLTNPVADKPYTLILLDEIEKAHPRVFDIFLQVLDDGRLTDGMGKTIDFSNTIIIATSNAGIEDILAMIQEGQSQNQIKKEIQDILQDYFRIEFINRFDDIVVFNDLKPETLKNIGKLQIKRLAVQLNKRRIGLTVSDMTLELLAQDAYDPRYGARGMLRLLQDTIENRVAEMIISGEVKEGQRIHF